MSDKPPTYRQRAIDTAVNNTASMRDLLIDLASEIDTMLNAAESPSTSEAGKTTEPNENEEN